MPNTRQAVFLITAIVLFSFTAFAQQSTPKAAVESFYKFDGANSRVFNQKNINARRKWFEYSLYKLFEKEIVREAALRAVDPSAKPHFGDGLPFRPLEEACQAGGKSYKYTTTVGGPKLVGETATVPVTFVYPKACNLPDTVYNVKLIGVKTLWLIVDIEYPGGETLVADLSRATY